MWIGYQSEVLWSTDVATLRGPLIVYDVGIESVGSIGASKSAADGIGSHRMLPFKLQ
jgi:hypothetical protein